MLRNLHHWFQPDFFIHCSETAREVNMILENTDRTEFDIALDQFQEYLTDILELYRQMIPLLREEFDHILKDDISQLDKNMKAQQALLLRTKNFDAKIAEYQSALIISGSTLSQMALQFPEEKRDVFFELIGQFQRTLEEVEFYKEKCRTLLQNKLYRIEKNLAKAGVQKNNKTYDQNAEEVRNFLISKAFEKKI